MPGVFDHLSAHLEDEDGSAQDEAGLSPLDLAELPGDQKLIMLALLRDSASAFDGVPTDVLRSKVDGKVEQFDPTVDLLAQQGWLIVMGEAPQTRYRLNFRAKRGSRSSFNLWTILTDRLPDDWKGMVKPDAT
jgi:hypothetical protein